MTRGLEDRQNEVKSITEMTPEELKGVPAQISFQDPSNTPDYIDSRVDQLTFDRDQGDGVYPHRMVTIPAAFLKRNTGSDTKLFVIRQENSDHQVVGVHFIEGAGELSGFSQVMFDGRNGRKKGEPYIMWSHTDKGFTGEGRGLLRTIVMGEYFLRTQNVQLDAGDMIANAVGGHKKIQEGKDYTHFLHIWETLERAKLAQKLPNGRYVYTGIRS